MKGNDMSCRAFAKKLPQYGQGLLSEKEALAIAQHLKGCPDCQSAAEQMGSVWADLGALPEADAPSVYPRVLARSRISRISRSASSMAYGSMGSTQMAATASVRGR